jgi:alanine racemase
MALTLYVDTAKWKAMVDATWASYSDLIPVVKGNGYGLGRPWLANQAYQRGAKEVAVGTIFEVAHVMALPLTPIVLTPSFDLDHANVPSTVVLTVASIPQIEHLARFRPNGPVVLKMASAALRHGIATYQVSAALKRLGEVGATIHSVAIHPALSATQEERISEIDSIVPAIPAELPVSVSHLGPLQFRALSERHERHSFRIRIGTALWHGNKGPFALRARVLDTRPVLAGTRAGYRSELVPGNGTIVIIDAGSVHGVAPLADGSCPFHYGHRRLTLIEPPHMHVSMAFVRNADPCPVPGDEVDVQRPLIATDADRIIWR